ncbi:MAG: hypothetical protein AAF821_00180 [Cyanobacteria bacterium P01_D01_bin.156]
MYAQEFDKDRIFEMAGVELQSDEPLLTPEQTQQFIDEEEKSEGWGDNPIVRALVIAAVIGVGGGGLFLLSGLGRGGNPPKLANDESEAAQQELLARITQLEQQNSELKAERAIGGLSDEPSKVSDAPSNTDEAEVLDNDDLQREQPDTIATKPESVPVPGPRQTALPPPPPPIQPVYQAPRLSPGPLVQQVPEIVPVADSVVVTPPVVEPVAELPPQFTAPAEPISPSVSAPVPEEPDTPPTQMPFIPEDIEPVQVAVDFKAPVTKQVLTGTEARIQLERELSWEEGRSQDRRILAELLEPLLFGDGTTWLEPGTRLVLANQGITGRHGEVQLDVIAYQHGGREHVVEAGAFVVQAANGDMVVARKHGGRTLGDDITDIVVDAAVEEAQELIEDSVGGIGGEILSSALERNKAILEPSVERPTRYVLERDAELTLEVNQPIEVTVEPEVVKVAEIPESPASQIAVTEPPEDLAADFAAAAPQVRVLEPAMAAGREQDPPTLAEPQADVLQQEQELPTLEHLIATIPDRDRGTESVVVQNEINEVFSSQTAPRISERSVSPTAPAQPCDRTTIPGTL